MKLGLFVSGGLGLDVLKQILPLYTPSFIATNKGSTDICILANLNRIRLFTGNPRNGKLLKFLEEEKFDLALSVNYLFILDKLILDKFNQAVNFHGSLLPKYRGRTPHVWAIINNEKETGVTAHLIDEGCDTGPVIRQVRISISDDCTGADILKEYAAVYPQMILEILNQFDKEKLETTPQDESRATYFGKRTPYDGLINWEWSKERIRNWIRAQAYPYPGAFTYYNKKKLVIDQVSFSDLGYHYATKNGTIICVQADGKPVVKVCNGCLVLENLRETETVFLKETSFHDSN
jgi:methionyl-tRNA formyltransferase